MRILSVILSAILLLSLIDQDGYCRETPDRIHIFTIEDGLSHTLVNTLYLDSLGFLWIGTSDGLSKYDGYSFTSYRNISFDTSSLSNNYIRSICEDRSGDIWVGTSKGLNRLDRKSGTFTRYNPIPGDPGSIAEALIYGVYADTNGIIWVKTSSSLESLDPKTGIFTHYPHETAPGIDKRKIISLPLAADSRGNIWFGGPEGLFYLTRNRHLEHYMKDGVNAICTNNQGQIWIGTNKGLFVAETGDRENAPIEKPEKVLSDIQIDLITCDQDGTLHFGKVHRFYTFYPGTGKLETQYYDELNQSGYEINRTNSMIVDRSDIIWLASSEGLIKVDKKRYQFSLINRSSIGMNEMPVTNISAIYAGESEIWLGTPGSGLYAWGESGVSRIEQLKDEQILDISADRNSDLLIGTSNGVYRLNSTTRHVSGFCEKYPEISCNALQDKSIFDILGDLSGYFWFATSNGVYKYHPEHKMLYHINSVYSGTETYQVRNVFTLLEDSQGMIWFGTDNGLVKHDPELKSYEVFRPANETEGSISSGIIYYLYQDRQGSLWVGTSLGLNRYDAEKQDFQVFTVSDGLPNNHVYSIVEDKDSCLWLSTNRGLTRFNPGKMEFSNYDLSDGIQNYQFNIGSVSKDKDGRLYFGGISGFNVFSPDSIPVNTHIPNIAFTSFEFDGKRGKLIRPLEKAFKIIVPRGNQVFTIRFAALDFTAPEKNRYKYQLVKNESDKMWIDIGTQHDVTFFNLPSGTYRFTVKGSNSDQKWNHEGASLDVIVPTSGWKSLEAYILYGFLTLIFIYAIVQFRTRNLRKSNRNLKEKETVARDVARQREELMIKNKNITDSIIYAKRIQFALIPTEEQFTKILPESFVLYKPKDIVSGDFYWINENQDKIYVAAIDCTGHGVPGAFMSIIGFELFRNITGVKKEPNPAKVLNSLNDNFVEIFSDGEQVLLKDGMDLSLCVFDKKERFLEFSGAFNPLYLIRDETIIEIKADRFSVGADIIQVPYDQRQFKSHKLYLQDDDILYMFSDGYADQFGGPEGKKFKYRRFRHLLLTIHKQPMEKQLAILDASIEEWRRGTDQIDDILVLGIRPFFGSLAKD